uniref:GNAT family N-acetyltransferase n=1 Tax=Algoriphagus sp. TaxID=1872435 RepID=UPI004047E8AB
MNNDILFFVRKPNNPSFQIKNENFNFITWRPNCRYKPKEIPFLKFFIWYLFYFLKIFRSKNFSINLLYSKNKLIHHTFIFPTFYRFPFMDESDIQFGDIWTSDNFKNQGIATRSLEYLFEIYSKNKIWFLCNKNNEASIILARKCGFELVGYGKKYPRFFNILSQYVITNKI